MTRRLYYTEPERRSFEAGVTACTPADGRFHVTLDVTAFYPTSGGQPFDTGLLGGLRVVDVVERDDDEVVHVVEGPLEPGRRVEGAIDWDRRFDHMQQHTGQHILSAAFDRLIGAPTVSFHLGAAGATIDVAREVSPVAVAKAEAEANRVVWENRDVAIRFVDAAEAARLPLRKEPARTGMLRLIDVADFDLSACGGTHVATTGVVGVIAVTGWERFKGGSRIGFVCGGRALAAHGRLRDVTTAIGQRLSVGIEELEAAVTRVQDEARDRGRELKRLHEELSGYRAASLAETAEPAGAFRAVLRHQPGGDAGSLKGLATAVAARPGLVVALVGDGTPAPVVLARSADVMVDAAMVIRALSAEFGGRGGGRPELAQGGIQATPDVILDRVRVRLTTGDV